MITTLQGSETEPVPLYLKPLLPAGLPRPFQLVDGRLYVTAFIGSPRSRISSEPPATVGSSAPAGSTNVPLARTLASVPGFTIMILPGMSWSAASAGVANIATSAAPTNIFLIHFCISPPFGDGRSWPSRVPPTPCEGLVLSCPRFRRASARVSNQERTFATHTARAAALARDRSLTRAGARDEPAAMRAILIREPGDESVLGLGEAPAPAMGPNDVRIRVRATAVNRADLLQRQGMYPPPPGASPILGLECAGDVREVGGAVRAFQVGQRVMALLAGGGYADEAVVDQGSVMPVPDALRYEEAGAFPEAFLTAFSNLFLPGLGAIAPGESALVHGGG